MKCIMVRMDAGAFLDVLHDTFPTTMAHFTRTEIFHLVGQLLCKRFPPVDTEEFLTEIFIVAVPELHRLYSKHEDPESDDYQAHLLSEKVVREVATYLADVVKNNLPYIPDRGKLGFIACVWYESITDRGDDSVCLIAEHYDEHESISETESDDPIRKSSKRDGTNSRYLSAVFK